MNNQVDVWPLCAMFLLPSYIQRFNMNATISNNFENFLDLDYPWKIFHGFLFTISILLVFGSYSGFIYFEHYAGDPMKRSIKDKLISQSFFVLMVAILVSNHGFAWRIIIGPLNDNISIMIISIRQFAATNFLLCITEVISFKVGVKVRNMKMDFNTGGTWRWVGQ